ncbi:hypothetical protein GGD83_002886 [Rhodoblastus sphagnicola]|nr:hypothetical protein [Rhodoblastus sphagnicola]MBB4199075.1 hypothetical protein [Rhodoblastus sphagnicola]
MSAIEHLTSAVATLTPVVKEIGDAITAETAKIKAGLASDDSATVEAAATQIDALTASLKDAAVGAEAAVASATAPAAADPAAEAPAAS